MNWTDKYKRSFNGADGVDGGAGDTNWGSDGGTSGQGSAKESKPTAIQSCEKELKIWKIAAIVAGASFLAALVWAMSK